jgi:hypothetical protein
MAMSSTAGNSKASVVFASLAGLHETSNAKILSDNSNFFMFLIISEKSSEPLQIAARLKKCL